MTTWQSRALSLYDRGGTIYIVPNVGLVDIGPVFTARPELGELSTALKEAFAAIPKAVPTTEANHRSPVLEAMKVKSARAFERELKSAVLQLGAGFEFYRFVPHPMFKTGFRCEDLPSFTLQSETDFTDLAEKVIATFGDPHWPMKESQLARPKRSRAIRKYPS